MRALVAAFADQQDAIVHRKPARVVSSVQEVEKRVTGLRQARVRRDGVLEVHGEGDERNGEGGGGGFDARELVGLIAAWVPYVRMHMTRMAARTASAQCSGRGQRGSNTAGTERDQIRRGVV